MIEDVAGLGENKIASLSEEAKSSEDRIICEVILGVRKLSAVELDEARSFRAFFEQFIIIWIYEVRYLYFEDRNGKGINVHKYLHLFHRGKCPIQLRRYPTSINGYPVSDASRLNARKEKTMPCVDFCCQGS